MMAGRLFHRGCTRCWGCGETFQAGGSDCVPTADRAEFYHQPCYDRDMQAIEARVTGRATKAAGVLSPQQQPEGPAAPPAGPSDDNGPLGGIWPRVVVQDLGIVRTDMAEGAGVVLTFDNNCPNSLFSWNVSFSGSKGLEFMDPEDTDSVTYGEHLSFEVCLDVGEHVEVTLVAASACFSLVYSVRRDDLDNEEVVPHQPEGSPASAEPSPSEASGALTPPFPSAVDPDGHPAAHHSESQSGPGDSYTDSATASPVPGADATGSLGQEFSSVTPSPGDPAAPTPEEVASSVMLAVFL